MITTIINKVLPEENLTRRDNIAYGRYRGYYTTIFPVNLGQGIVLKITYQLSEGADRQAFTDRAYEQMKHIRDSYKNISSATVKEYFLEIIMSYSTYDSDKKVIACIEDMSDRLTRFLQAEGCGSGCQICGSGDFVNCYHISGGAHFLCESCKQGAAAQIEAVKQNKAMEKSNAFLGSIGAVAGSLIGVALWVLIYQFGFMAGLAGALIVLAAMKGYEMLGKYLDKKGVIICVVIAVFMVYFANKLSWSIEAYRAFSKEGLQTTFFATYRNLMPLLKLLDITGSYYLDLAVGYLLTIVASYTNIIRAFRNVGFGGSYDIKKM